MKIYFYTVSFLIYTAVYFPCREKKNCLKCFDTSVNTTASIVHLGQRYT